MHQNGLMNGNGALRTLKRNRFFYGKRMDVRQWTMEQTYSMAARQLLARLGLGSGVLCGLDVSVDPDGSLVVTSGVAVDHAGREIVVPHDVRLPSAAQPTDCLGRPDGDPVQAGTVAIGLCYHECLTEFSPAVECGCETVERCEAGVVSERFSVTVERGEPDERPGFPCDRIFPAPPPSGFDRRREAFAVLHGPCAPASGACVTLATVTFAPPQPPVVDTLTHRRVLLSNEVLYELILCLAARVDACCGGTPPPVPAPRVLRAWPRDGQVLATTQVERATFLKRTRIELTFERPMDSAALAAPDPWLRVHSLRLEGRATLARRVGVTYLPTFDQLVMPPGADEQAAVFALDSRARAEANQGARFVVQVRPDDGGARLLVDTSASPLVLDAEHHGTGLSQVELDGLWSAVTSRSTPAAVAMGMFQAVFAGVGAPFPTGDGQEGGSLDLGFALGAADVQQPQLLAVWPPNAAVLGPQPPGDPTWWTSMRETPRVELTFDGTLDPAVLAALNVDDWLGVWWLVPQGSGMSYAPKRLPLAIAGEVTPTLPVPAGSRTVALKVAMPIGDVGHTNPFVVAVRGDRASVDADFAGLALTPTHVDDLFGSDSWPGGIAVTGPSSIGVPMADGVDGGTAVTFFLYTDDA